MLEGLDLRAVEPEDEGKLLSVSYSKLDLFLQCNYRYKLKYINCNYDDSRAIALNVGSICHKVLEVKGLAKMNDQPVDYDKLNYILHHGCKDGREEVFGIDQIKAWYFEDWYKPDDKSGMNYEEKMKLFQDKVIRWEMEDAPWTWTQTGKKIKEEVLPDGVPLTTYDAPHWKVIGCEVPFKFVYKDKMIIHGFIDRIDQNEIGQFRVIDYKTSKASYREEKIRTPLQMAIYGMACEFMYGKLPIEYLYRFVLIDETQEACTSGYMERAIKKMDKTFDKIEKCKEKNIYSPDPSPLCYWCSFGGNNPVGEFKGMCPYYSLWTPENKTFSVNQTYNVLKPEVAERKLIF